MNKKFLFVIPARAGSKGIPNKNIRVVKGIPLIEYTLKSLENLDRADITVVVSSDSKEILEISRRYDVELLERPKELSGDTSKTVDLILHILSSYEINGKTFSHTVLLQPTSPLRSEKDVEDSIEIFLKSKATSLISTYPLKGVKETYIYKETPDKKIIPLSENHAQGLPRQMEGHLFVRNGAIYIADNRIIKEEKKLISDKPSIYVMPKSRSINIDTLEDLKAFEKIA
tara:strand:+ start:5669 stop:6355 length:687 start_codon:yes stop_codon:yes gene_type:complete